MAAPLLVRSWNLFHGRTFPPGRRGRLEEMVRLASADRPDVLLLQELPVWALDRLDDWSGMIALGDVAAPPRIGPFPSTPELGHAITRIHPGRLRAAFSGQANAILLAPHLRVLGRWLLVLNSREFRRRQARWLGLAPVDRLAWAKERRICSVARVRLRSGQVAVVANLHATSYRPDERLADAEILRAAVFVDALAEPPDVCIVGGDFNARARRSWTLRDLGGPDWGFSRAGAGIDHVLVRGAEASRLERWPDERRRRDGRLLSDHAPVEVRVG